MNDQEAAPRGRGRRHDPAEENHSGDSLLAALDGMNVGQLRRIAAAAEMRIREKSENERKALKEEMERRAADLGISLRELFDAPRAKPGRRRGRPPGTGAKKKAAAKAVQPKYRGPNGELWSGRGRPPRWMAALVAEGRAKDDFLIKSKR